MRFLADIFCLDPTPSTYCYATSQMVSVCGLYVITCTAFGLSMQPSMLLCLLIVAGADGNPPCA